MSDTPSFSNLCRPIVEEIGQALVHRKWLLASAESCTAGWFSKACTDLPGSSAWFECSISCYSNYSKREWLGVRHATIDHFGAVSDEVVAEMVQGLLNRSRASIGVAISGIAGPNGNTEDKPVGTVCFAWRTKDGFNVTQRTRFDGSRTDIRQQSIFYALSGIKQILNSKEN